MAAENRVVEEVVINVRTEGAQKATHDLDQLADAHDRVAGAEGQAVVVSEKNTRARLSAAPAVDRLQKQLDQEYRATRQLADAQRVLDRARSQGLLSLGEHTRLTGMAARRYDEAASAARRAANDNHRAGASFGAVAGSLRTNIAMLAGFVATIGGAALVQGISKAGLELDSLERGFAAAAGSAEQGAREFTFIRDTSDRLGLSLLDTSKQYLGFMAASRGTALQGRETREIFVAVSSAMGALGKGTEETGRALVAVQQMMSKGKVSAEEMNGQLGEALPGALSLSAKAMGMTTQELVKFMGEGKLLASDLLPKLARELRATYGEAAEKASQGLRANLNRASTAWLDYRDTIARNGLNDALSRAAGDMAAFLNDNREAAASLGRGLGSVVDWLRSVSAAAVEAYDSASVILQMIREADQATPQTVDPAKASGFIRDFLATALEFDAMVLNKIVGSFVAAYQVAVAAWNGLPAAFGGFGAAAANALISAVEGAVNLTIAGFNKVVDAINGIGANVPGFSNLAKAAEVSFGRIEAAGESTVGKLGSDLATIGKEALGRDYLGEVGQRFTDLKAASAAAREERRRLAEQVRSDKLADALSNTGDGAAKAAKDLDAAGKAAKAAAKEFADLKSAAEQAFKIAFPEEALRKQGMELQAQLNKYRDKLAAEDPRYVEALEMKIRLNLEGRELEKVSDKASDLAREMSRTFSGVFDDMFSSGTKGFDDMLGNVAKGVSRIGTRVVGEAGGFNFDDSDELEMAA